MSFEGNLSVLLHVTLFNSIQFLQHRANPRNSLMLYHILNVITDKWSCSNEICFAEGQICLHD